MVDSDPIEFPDIDQIKSEIDRLRGRFETPGSVIGKNLFISRPVPPPSLYKYTHAATACLIIESGRIRYTQASQLDDIFEEGISKEQINDIRADYEDGPTFIVDLSDTEERLQMFDRVRDARQLLRANGAILADDYLFITMNGFNPRWKYELGNRPLKHAFEATLTPLAFSLSEIENDSQLWSLYGDMHRGVCIGFNARDQYFRQNRDYINRNGFFASIEYRELSIDDYCYRYPFERFFLKTPDWAWQKEWRRIQFVPREPGGARDNGVHTFEYPPSAISSITFGARCSSDNMNEITQTLASKKEFDHVQIFRSWASYGGISKERIF